MPKVTFEAHTFELTPGESVLDGLLREGFEIPHGCRGGACQSCALKVTNGEVPAKAQQGLKETQKQLGVFLSCSCVPQSDLTIATTHTSPKHQAEVVDCTLIAPQVLRVRLRADISFSAGQYLNIWLDGQHLRSYSIASLPTDGFIELHIKVIPGGRFSGWAKEHLQPGDQLTVQGPLGECIYTQESTDRPILLLGCGTGLAPLYGIVRDALSKGHNGVIHLVVAARDFGGLYLQQELKQLCADAPNLQVSFVCQNELPALPGGVKDDIYAFVKSQYANAKGLRIYLCGGDSFVRKLKKQCFLAGAAMKDIHSDAFLPCA